ncbi:ABC transporter substrate-binding protein [Desulfoluna spongiiphila]|uniref:ABC-type Fe3+ transport system, substrate-binding protein n=1 Tax=Desulfoluna spongiiphila TaxID=419481 RepID=A0A1G5FL75_9BACT|nr:extracellular solute-binding protein [Desulfoluna spongiiphila]SCY40009.1 ABC-type Fe3+ transport system, substrate-binding protein [Desulfoluna spongiiphila]
MFYSGCSWPESSWGGIHSSKTRRLFRSWAILCVAVFCVFGKASASEGQGTQRYLDIITSFPPEFYTPFVTAFSRKYPDIQVMTSNKKTTSALVDIKRGNPHRFDLFWSSSTDAFAMLKAEHRLLQLPGGRRHPALAVDGVHIDDPEGYFMGFALSGVGWMWNPAYLKRESIPVPERWEDLVDPVYYGHLAMSTPSRSGTTHLIVESLLQELGWEQGWAMLLKMAGNLRTVSARSFSVPEGLINGRFGVGLGIDFLGQSRRELGFRYGTPVFLVPAGIGLLAGGTNPDEAALFIDFILSPEGQEILREPTVCRLPVSREVHDRSTGDAPDLLKLIRKKQLKPYDADLSRSRYHLVNQLFDRMITYRLTERRSLWKRYLALEQQSGTAGMRMTPLKEELADLLCGVPVTGAQSRDHSFTDLFAFAARGTAPTGLERDETERWDAFLSRRLDRARALLTRAESELIRSRQ